MNKLRVSYTLLNLWKSGRVVEAVKFYFKLEQLKIPALEEGKKWDLYVQNHVDKFKKLPDEFGGDVLTDPKTQVKLVVPFNEICDVVGVFDILDLKTIYEIKSGWSKDSGEYASDFQVSMYLMLAGIAEIDVDKALIVHYNQREKKQDRSLIWNTSFETKRAENLINTLAPEIHSYFTDYDLWNKQFDKK